MDRVTDEQLEEYADDNLLMKRGTDLLAARDMALELMRWRDFGDGLELIETNGAPRCGCCGGEASRSYGPTAPKGPILTSAQILSLVKAEMWTPKHEAGCRLYALLEKTA
jgi:hypothetical protein